MRERDYYPLGAYNDPNAPYNEPVIPEEDFEVTVSQTLSKTVTITTDKYIPEFDDETRKKYMDTSEIDWKNEYKEQHFSIQELLSELKDYVLADFNNTVKGSGKYRHLQKLLEACDGWTEDEFEVIED